jgi:hypothetical protein
MTLLNETGKLDGRDYIVAQTQIGSGATRSQPIVLALMARHSRSIPGSRNTKVPS